MNGLHTLDEGVRIAFESIRVNKIRSGLTILGVAIGVGVIVLIAALVTGIRTSIMEGFETATIMWAFVGIELTAAAVSFVANDSILMK